jgi:AcrR family transcriptional regulator
MTHSSKPPAIEPPPVEPARRRSYDTLATRQRIADAAVALLTERGFTALGINALAGAAGVDKQLIYYHFGGLDGVVRHVGGQVELWLGTPLQVLPGEAYGVAVARLLLQYQAALRSNPVLMRLLTWELAEPSATLAELEAARSQAMGAWVEGLRRDALPPPPGVDAPAVNAVLLAALQHLSLREHAVGSFAGVELRSESGRQRIADAIRCITERVYAPLATPATRAPGSRS